MVVENMRILIAAALLVLLMCNGSVMTRRYKIAAKEFDKYIAKVKNAHRIMIMENYLKSILMKQARVIFKTVKCKKQDDILKTIKIMERDPYNLRLS